MTTTIAHRRRALLIEVSQFLSTVADVAVTEAQADQARELETRALMLSFPDGGVDFGREASQVDGYREHSVTLAKVDAILQGEEAVDPVPYPDGADMSHVVEHAKWIMQGFTGMVAAAGAPKVGPRVH